MSGYYYLATPYSRYKRGLNAAFKLACREAGRFIRDGIPVVSPIAHSHPIAIHAKLDPLDHGIWLPADQPLMNAATGLIVCMADGWRESLGIAHEIAAFEAAKKPVLFYSPFDAEEYEGMASIIRRNISRTVAA